MLSQKRLTHEIIANLTGLTRPTVTIVLNDLKRLKVIQSKKNELVDIDDKLLEEIIFGHLF